MRFGDSLTQILGDQIYTSESSKMIHLLLVKGFFWPVPYLAFPLYRNSRTGNGTETRHTIFAGDVNIIYNSLLKIVYYFFSPSHPLSGFDAVLSKYNSYIKCI
jgi:hypothetical protein